MKADKNKKVIIIALQRSEKKYIDHSSMLLVDQTLQHVIESRHHYGWIYGDCSHNDTKLQSIMSLLKDLLLFLQNLSASTPSIGLVYSTVPILERLKVLLMYLLI